MHSKSKFLSANKTTAMRLKMTENGNGTTERESLRHMTKSMQDTLVRVEAKLDAHLIEARDIDDNARAERTAIDRRLELHASDDHAKKVAELRDAEMRDQGRSEVYRYIFGASLLGFVAGIIGLIATVWSLLNG